MKKFTSKGIEVTDKTTVKQKGYMYRTKVPKKLEAIITEGITSIRFDGLTAVVNCGGKQVMADGRIYLPIDLIRTLKLAHGDVLIWKLSYTSTGIKITVEGKR